MPNVDFSFPGRSEAFSVRGFRIEDGISRLFTVSVSVRSELDDADLDALAGSDAMLSLATPSASGGRPLCWRGVCSHAELLHAEPTGLSTYAMTLVPELWLLTQRSACRVFRRLTAAQIVEAVLREWGITPELRITATDHPVLDFRVQYNESDFAFVSRTLEEAGIAYFFRSVDDHTTLVLADRPAQRELHGEPIPFRAEVSTAGGRPYATSFYRSTRVRPGAWRARDYDHLRPSFDLRGDTPPTAGASLRPLERYEFLPGASVAVDPLRPSAMEGRAEQSVLAAVALRRLEAANVEQKVVRFHTNVIDLAPGLITAITGHPRSDISADTRLLVTTTTLEGSATDDVHLTVKAVFASRTYRPAIHTPRPWIVGVQSATVVGPPGEEIHVDEQGRVRVLFPWDQEGARGDGSSCWVRVSQSWAGAGFGITAIPRVSDEVLVAFLDGDPDMPVVVGRLHNATHRHPYRLPEDKATTGLKTQSTPGGTGYNELRFDDRAANELVLLRAQRHLDETVVADHTTRVGHDRRSSVGGDQVVSVAGNLSHGVGGNRSDQVTGDRFESTSGSRAARIDGNHTTEVQGHCSLAVQGALAARCEGSLGAVVAGDLSISAHGGLSISVGSTDAAGASAHARGSWLIGSDRDVVIQGARSVSVQCGESVIRLLPDKIEISTKTLVLIGKEQIAMKGDQAEIELAGEARIAAPATRLFGDSSSLELTANASMKGTKVKLNHREGDPPKRSAEAVAPETKPFRVRLCDASHASYADRAYELVVDGVRLTGTTDGEGMVSQDIPIDAMRASLVLWVGDSPTGERHEWALSLGDLLPASTLDGARNRLTNLGYTVGAGEALDPVTRRALRAFQQAHDLEVTGELDAETASQLEQLHGH